MASREVHLELLLSTRVRALNGQSLGRIEELRLAARGEEMVVEEFLIGPYGLLERLSARLAALAILRFFARSRPPRRYRVAWHQLDLSDPHTPRLRCRVEELN